MDELTKNLASLGWWLGVVLVGILLNIVSAFLKSPIDRALSAASSRWRTRSIARKESDRLVVENLRGNAQGQLFALAHETRCRLRSIFLLLLTVLLLMFYAILRVVALTDHGAGAPIWLLRSIYWVSLFAFFFSMHSHLTAMKWQSFVLEAFDDAPSGNDKPELS